MTRCPFCEPPPGRVFHEGELFRCLWDRFPVSKGHALVVTRRHVAEWFDASRKEQAALLEGIEIARAEIIARHAPDGFNIGVNVGEAAGQTVRHLHVHVIPRYRDDVADPRGGVRHVIPGKANYLVRDSSGSESDAYQAPSAEGRSSRVADLLSRPYDIELPRVVGSDANPIVDHLLCDLARAKAVDIAVAFVTHSGLDRILPHLDDIVTRGGALRFLTGDYLGVTDPVALRSLLDLEPAENGSIERRVFECSKDVGFHPKAYLIHGHDDDGAAYVGSSNLTEHGLARGIEWNYRVAPKQDPVGFRAIAAEFEQLFAHPCTKELTYAWIEHYERKRPAPSPTVPAEVEPEITTPPEPYPIQQEALEALGRTREAGNRAGLVVLATGLGKTWLAAFDAQSFRRVLFIAHREEILKQALRTFRAIRPNASLGHYTGKSKDPGADIVFASIQTIARSGHLARFDARAFDYIVVDEFHHADAKTYRRLIDHFEPAFLLGLTATPERTDGGDLLALCGENLVYRCDLAEGIEQGLLCPFHYFGIPDNVEYQNIPWRSGRFDEHALETAVATEARAANAFEQWQARGGARTLAFCVSQRHADFMAAFFTERGVRCAAVHTGPGAAPRALSLEQLRAGELDVVFSVDMFNEGVDLPAIDTVLLLRPTESRILWLQQFGRGLRRAENKPHLNVIDYVGNHQTFLKAPMLLFPGVGESPADVAMALERYETGDYALPPGCTVTYDLEAVAILRKLTQMSAGADKLRIWYEAFRYRNGMRPTALETWHAGHDPKSVRKSHGSWFGFVATMGDASDAEQEAQRAASAFLRELGTTPMTKSYKMLVLLAMIAEEAFPRSIALGTLTEAVARRARRNAALATELGTALADQDALRRLLVESPIAAWTGGKGTGDTAYFAYEGETLRSLVDCPASATEALREMTRELCEWRLGQYLERIQGDQGRVTPVGAHESNAIIGAEYTRVEIAPLWGLPFEDAKWRQSGFIWVDNHMFLLVTLEKGGMREEHRYQDRFLDVEHFQWQSQNRTPQGGKVGQALRHHQERGIAVHLLVRRFGKTQRGKATPYTYCGELEFQSWEGEKPITIRWRLARSLPVGLLKNFEIA